MRRLGYERGALKFLRRLKKGNRSAMERIVAATRELPEEPFPAGSRKLRAEGPRPLHRIRVGDYRVIYTATENLVQILDIDHRKNVYRDL